MSNETTAKSGAPGQMLKLHSMNGDWHVQFESRPAADATFVLHHITSSIRLILNGAFLQEHISIPSATGVDVNLIGLLGYDRFREIFRFAWLDDTYAVFDVHEGNWDADTLIVNNLRSGTTFRFGEQEYFSRMIWQEITSTGFRMESHLSMDMGKTWFTQAKAFYTRRT